MPPYSCVLVPTVVCADVLWLPSPNYACVVPCDNCSTNATATITVFLLKICVNCVYNIKKTACNVVLTFLLNGGLNQMILRCLFVRGCCVSWGICSSLWLTLLCPKCVLICLCCIFQYLFVRWQCWNAVDVGNWYHIKCPCWSLLSNELSAYRISPFNIK